MGFLTQCGVSDKVAADYEIMKAETNSNKYSTVLLSRHWLTDRVFELELLRPESFKFNPGQCIRFHHKTVERDYSLITTPADHNLALCLYNVQGGLFSPLLASAEIGTGLSFSGPHGYFTYRPSTKPAVFVATGTGIAPFLSMARAGAKEFTLLHGVKTSNDLYYESFFLNTARMYIPCLSRGQTQLLSRSDGFQGRVTEYLRDHLPGGTYDFYLCGRQEMIRDATLLADARFPGSLVYTETFY